MRSPLRGIYRAALAVASANWKAYSRLILAGDEAGWVLDWEMREVFKIAQRLGIPVIGARWQHVPKPQSVFLANQFFLLQQDWLNMPHRIGFAYFHGLPGTGDPLFDQVYENLGNHHERITRIQVSHSQMRDVTLQCGIDPSKVFLIPIGINLNYFPLRDAITKYKSRKQLGIPQSSFVVGSFQKDGVGWGEGNEPKLVKGPDILLQVIRRLKEHIPDLFVLLSGPARGYVTLGLNTMKVPYKHIYIKTYPDISKLYQALDVYLVTSRQEGGPKAVLESMASGIPIISTCVGQAMDLIEDGQNGWLVEPEDIESLVHHILRFNNLDDSAKMSIIMRGRRTAELNSYEAQIPLWASFMKGFVG